VGSDQPRGIHHPRSVASPIPTKRVEGRRDDSHAGKPPAGTGGRPSSPSRGGRAHASQKRSMPVWVLGAPTHTCGARRSGTTVDRGRAARSKSQSCGGKPRRRLPPPCPSRRPRRGRKRWALRAKVADRDGRDPGRVERAAKIYVIYARRNCGDGPCRCEKEGWAGPLTDPRSQRCVERRVERRLPAMSDGPFCLCSLLLLFSERLSAHQGPEA
jgi:hypothetical protein